MGGCAAAPVRAFGPPADLCGGAPPSTPPGVTAGPLRAPDPQGDSFYGERVTRKPGGGKSPATPLRSPSPPREKVSLRSPLSDGGKTSSGTRVPIQEATSEGRSLPRALIDRPPGYRQSGLPQGITAGSPACGYHQYSSKYSAGTCPRVAETQPFLVFPNASGNRWKTTWLRAFPSRADRGGTPVNFVRAA